MASRNRRKHSPGPSTAPALFPESDEENSEDDKLLVKKNVKNGGGGGGGGFQINKNYADNYDNWRNKEELMKMKARFGTSNPDEVSDSEESSSSEEEWTEEKEKAFFKTLSNLKKKDPKIYDPNVRFFQAEEDAPATVAETSTTKKNSTKNNKPFLLKDHERTMILEKGGLISDSEGEDGQKKEEPQSLSYYQELDSIRKGFKEALNKIESDDEEENGDNLLTKGKSKTEEEKKQEDVDYRLWLKGELERLDKGKLPKEDEKELSFLRSYWNDDKLDEGEKFLRDYILNRKYVEQEEEKDEEEEEEDHVPSYNEIAHDSDEEGLSNDEQFEQKREEFEHKYNFRFEEPDPEFVKRFPRTIEDSLRREDERRKKHRESAKERKKEAKERKREEVQRLKAFKRKQIMEKLQQLQEISGNPDLPLDDLDIDGDFDPEEYDKKMKKVFDEQYYQDEADEEKPKFPHDPEIDDESWHYWVPKEEQEEEAENPTENQSTSSTSPKKKKKQTEDAEAVNDEEKVDVKSTVQQELIESSKKKGKKSPFLEVLEKKKPKFNPEVHKTFDQYFQEYYSLDFEDLIGDLPCRFKYRKVAANDFGLTTTEILTAEDNELNQWASLKKTYQYRPEEEEKYEAQAYKKKAQNEKLKKQVLTSVYKSQSNDNNDKEDETMEETADSTINGTTLSKSKKKKKKKKKKPKMQEVEPEIKQELEDVPENIESVQVENPSKKKKSVSEISDPPATPKGQSVPDNNAKKAKNKQHQHPNKNQDGNQRKSGKRKAEETDVGVEDDRLKAYGLNPKKYKKWVKYGGKAQK